MMFPVLLLTLIKPFSSVEVRAAMECVVLIVQWYCNVILKHMDCSSYFFNLF